MRSKPFKKLQHQLPDILSEALPRHCIEGIPQFVHQATIAFVSSKNRTLLRQGVCVTHLHRCKTSDNCLLIMQGVDDMSLWESSTNEDAHMLW